MKFLDSHAHYNDEKFKGDRDELLEELQNETSHVIVAGFDANSSKEAISLANNYHYIYATVGISPNDIENFEEKFLDIAEIAKEEKVVAIGEIGLDYHWNTENKQEQKQAFRKQIQFANNLRKPIVIHTREAVLDTLTILKEENPVEKGVFHCCPLNPELIKEGLKLGFYISFAGPITFKNSKNADTCIQLTPMEKMLIETDSPYLSPEPNRGKRNDSTSLKYIAQKIAEIKQIEIEKVAKQTQENAKKIFKIP